jgi:hypothetical protein
MPRVRTGRLYWDTTGANTPRWAFEMDNLPNMQASLLPVSDPSLPRDASESDLHQLVADTLQESRYDRPQDIQISQTEEGYDVTLTYTY